MFLKVFVIYCLIASSFAWLAPDRCKQSNRNRRTVTAAKDVVTVPNVDELAARQNKRVKEYYVDHKFLGVPIRGGCATELHLDMGYNSYMFAPYNCTFHTYKPRLLSSVACTNTACKLIHTVSTVDTYASSEGYNWGVKISAKASFFDKLFEVGGEASTGGSYSCAFTQGKTTTDTVECSESTGKGGDLQLYNVKTDMDCYFGRITLTNETRGNRIYADSDAFTQSELEEIDESRAFRFEPCLEIMIDTSKISDTLLRKIMKEIPHYNPYTDMVYVRPIYAGIRVFYFKKTITDEGYTKTIPFTTETGDSVFQYACTLTPFST